MHIGFVILNCHKNVIINNSIALINHFLIPGAQELVNLMGDNGFEMDGTTYVLTTLYQGLCFLSEHYTIPATVKCTVSRSRKS